METRESQSNIASRNAPNGGIAGENNIKVILGKDCKVTNVIKFLKKIEMFEKMWTTPIGNKISMTIAMPYCQEWSWHWINQLNDQVVVCIK